MAENELCSNWDLLKCDYRFFDPNYEMILKYGNVSENDSGSWIEDIDNEMNASEMKQQLSHLSKREKKLYSMREKKLSQQKQRQIEKQLNNKSSNVGRHKHRIRLIKFKVNKWPMPYRNYSKKSGNLSMSLIYDVTDNKNSKSTKNNKNNNNNAKFFQFEFDKDYNLTQMEFLQRRAMYRVDDISFMLSKHPYHVDTLLCMSDILSQMGKLEDSNDLIERGLYRLEQCLHSRFNYIDGNCRLDYNINSNQSFFKCLWRYGLNIGRRGCVHSAFEIYKLIFSLSPIKDPLCSLLCLDNWALRSNELEWILSFVESFKINRKYIFYSQDEINGESNETKNDNNNNDNARHKRARLKIDVMSDDDNGSDNNYVHLRMLPNWAYSAALASYYIENKMQYDKKSKNKNNGGYRFGSCDTRGVFMCCN